MTGFLRYLPFFNVLRSTDQSNQSTKAQVIRCEKLPNNIVIIYFHYVISMLETSYAALSKCTENITAPISRPLICARFLTPLEDECKNTVSQNSSHNVISLACNVVQHITVHAALMTLPKRVIYSEIDGRESVARAGSAVCAYSSAAVQRTEDGDTEDRGQRTEDRG